MSNIHIVIGLLIVAAMLIPLARRLQAPYPLLLVIGGLALGFVPHLPTVRMDPGLVFLVFLPPLLFLESWQSSWRDFVVNLRPILLLSIGLVMVTTVAVAAVAHWVIPGFSWPVALVMGAVIAPTDELAATVIAQRLRVPGRIIAIISDESLVNDGISLVLYQLAALAVVTGKFSVGRGCLDFVLVSVGGTGIGLVIAWIVSRLMRLVRQDTAVTNLVGAVSPFAAYFTADSVHVSGVLAVVAAGLYLGRKEARLLTAAARLQADGFWETMAFILNGLLFILVGLQLRPIMARLRDHSLLSLIGDAALICTVTVVVRMAWVFPAAYIPRRLSRRVRTRETRPTWQALVLIGWTGIRGATSLAAALAVPLLIQSGKPFPQRDLIIFITFSVIFVTLVLQGLSLPWLIRELRIKDDKTDEREETHGRLHSVRAALSKLDELAASHDTPKDIVEDLRHRLTLREQRFAAQVEHAQQTDKHGADEAATDAHRKHAEHEKHANDFYDLMCDVIKLQRRAAIDVRDKGEIGDEAFRRIQHDLDLEQARLDD